MEQGTKSKEQGDALIAVEVNKEQGTKKWNKKL
jgi:hypothetical protein